MTPMPIDDTISRRSGAQWFGGDADPRDDGWGMDVGGYGLAAPSECGSARTVPYTTRPSRGPPEVEILCSDCAEPIFEGDRAGNRRLHRWCYLQGRKVNNAIQSRPAVCFYVYFYF